MMIHDDLTTRTIVHAGDMDWVPSPMPGVDRRMLFRIGGEKARATSIVRYAPGSSFSRHDHPGGEEIFVLDGVFQDETGDFPAGSYIRNPPGTGHAPASASGCTIFVKLWQFSAADSEQVVRRPGERETAAQSPGVQATRLLFESPSEHVMIETWHPGAEIAMVNPEGLELLVLSGSIEIEGSRLGEWGWLRIPQGEPLHAIAGADGAAAWIKSAPLLHADVCPFEDESFDAVI